MEAAPGCGSHAHKCMPKWSRSRRGHSGCHGGFSLVEVTLALGILAFCLVTMVALLPVGLNSQKDAMEEARASGVLQMATAAVRSASFSYRDAAGVATFALPEYFSDSAGVPRTFAVGEGAQSFTLFIGDDGSILRTTDTEPPQQILHVRLIPPESEGKPVKVYAAVAWPWQPGDSPTTVAADLASRQGLEDTFIVYVPRN